MIEVGVFIVIFGSDGLLCHLSVILQFLEVLRLLALIIGRNLLFLGVQTFILLTLSFSVFTKDVHTLLKPLLLNLCHTVVVFRQANLTGRVESGSFQLLSLGAFLGIIQLFFEVCLALGFCLAGGSFTLLSFLLFSFSLLLCCIMTSGTRCFARACTCTLETLLLFLFIQFLEVCILSEFCIVIGLFGIELLLQTQIFLESLCMNLLLLLVTL